MNPTYISLFTGGGGLDLGLEMAGWHAAYASDIDPAAVATLQANIGVDVGDGRRCFDRTYIERADITLLAGADILAKAGMRRGDVQMLAGGPPCQSWSSAGYQLGFDDPRGRLFDDFIRVGVDTDVRWLLIENVRGLLTARGAGGEPGSALVAIRTALLKAGFQTSVGLLNSADYGVPQRRVRLFLIGFRAGDPPPFPKPTHAKAPDLTIRERWVPLSRALQAIDDLSETEIIRPNGKMAADLAGLRPGSGVKSPGKAERTRPGGHWGYKQGGFVADPDLPARTVTAGQQQDWILDEARGLRRLCARECAAIQSFPPAWKFSGNAAAQLRQIGNAVPPLLAKAIGKSLLQHLYLQEHHNQPPDKELLPLPAPLAYHVAYTAREEASNGHSRRQAPRLRAQRISKIEKATQWL